MKPLKIGYQSLSLDLSHPGDRRRIVFWAKNRGHEILVNETEDVDIIVISEKADFNKFEKSNFKAPIVFDLIDGYLAPEHFVTDFTRGATKVLASQLSGRPKKFTSFIKALCEKSDLVICSTPEQQITITAFARNVHVILDSHDEFPLLASSKEKDNYKKTKELLWEGMPYTLEGIRQLDKPLQKISNVTQIQLNILADLTYSKYLGKYFTVETQKIIINSLKRSHSISKLTPWTLRNIVEVATNTNLAVIPINLKSPLQFLKPENRLLIMWRLGLPCLTSASPAYTRVMTEAGIEGTCTTESDWEEMIRQLLSDREYAEKNLTLGQKYLTKFHSKEILLEKWDRAIASIL